MKSQWREESAYPSIPREIYRGIPHVVLTREPHVVLLVAIKPLSPPKSIVIFLGGIKANDIPAYLPRLSLQPI